MQGDILGAYLNSITMTLSIPQDKLTRLDVTLQTYLDVPAVTLKEMNELLGFWEFCSALLPKFMRGFAWSMQRFRCSLLLHNIKRKRWLPKRVRRDIATIKALLPEVNNTVPIQPSHGKPRADPCCTDACGGKNPGLAWVTPTKKRF